jgi:transmembrane sensor
MTVESDADIRRREAAAWFARLKQRRVESDDIRAFSEWRRSPENAAAFARVESMWDAAEVLAHDADIAALTASAATRDAARRPTLKQKLWPALGATLAAAAALGALGFWHQQRPQIYETETGERRVVQLTDGSTVHLDTDSRIAVRLRGSLRRIELMSGQALFDVAHDTARPFVVDAGEARVTALGTRFDVFRLGEEVRVILVEGQIRVETPKAQRPGSWTLEPGEQVVPSARSPVVAKVDAIRATSWTSGRLIFDQTPLAAAVAEINRHSRTKIELRAAGVAETPVSGAFDAGDVEGFVSAVTELYPVRIESAGDGVIVLRDAPKK